MDNKTDTTPIGTLIHYQLVSCNAYVAVDAKESKGGNVEFTISYTTPDEGTVLRSGETYSAIISLDCTGKVGETETIAFHADCKMEGVYKIYRAPEQGFKSSVAFWAQPVNQLYPLISQYVTEMIGRMGFRNIAISPSIEGFAPQVKEKNKKPKKSCR